MLMLFRGGSRKIGGGGSESMNYKICVDLMTIVAIIGLEPQTYVISYECFQIKKKQEKKEAKQILSFEVQLLLWPLKNCLKMYP